MEQDEQKEVEEIYQDILIALEDVDLDDREALNERCYQIIEDIHRGRF